MRVQSMNVFSCQFNFSIHFSLVNYNSLTLALVLVTVVNVSVRFSLADEILEVSLLSLPQNLPVTNNATCVIVIM